jgi:hypothetical protein
MRGKIRDDRRCTATNARGEQCDVAAITDPAKRLEYGLTETDPLLCNFHAGGDDFRAKGLAERRRLAEVNREAAELEGRLEGLAFVTLEHLLKVCTDAMSANDEYFGRPDHSVRLAAVAVLLHVFPKKLRSTPEEATALLHSLLDGTRKSDAVRQDMQANYRSLRQEWFKIALRHDDIAGLFYLPVPPSLLAEWETQESVAHEVPETNELRIEKLSLDGREIGYVHAVYPDGTKILVKREDVPRAA